QPGSAPAGGAITGPPRVEVRDALGNLVSSAATSITVAIGANPSGGTLSGTTTRAATAGAATFSGLGIDRPATGSTLTASPPARRAWPGSPASHSPSPPPQAPSPAASPARATARR